MNFSQTPVNQQQQAGTFNSCTYNALSPSQNQMCQPQQIFSMPQSQAQFIGPPDWASGLIEDVKQIKSSMTKLDQIERTVNMINMKVSDLEVKVNTIEPKVTEVERSCSFMSDENSDRKRELDRARSELSKLRIECVNVQAESDSLRMKNAALKSRITDLESRSMRDNLLFYGITERGQQENCEELVKGICAETLALPEARNFTFDRVHRIGNFSNNRIRPIVAKFHYYKEREIVRQKAYDNSETLKRQNLGIGKHWPSEERERRKALFPIMQREKSQGKNVKLVKDKLYVNNVEYKLAPQERSQTSAPVTSGGYVQPLNQHQHYETNYQNYGPPPRPGFIPQQSPTRAWTPPPPPVPPGHPGTFQWTPPGNRMMAPAHQMSQQLTQPRTTQRQNSMAQQQTPVQTTPVQQQQQPIPVQQQQHSGLQQQQQALAQKQQMSAQQPPVQQQQHSGLQQQQALAQKQQMSAQQPPVQQQQSGLQQQQQALAQKQQMSAQQPQQPTLEDRRPQAMQHDGQ